MKNKKSLEDGIKSVMEKNPELSKEFIHDILQASDEDALIELLNQSQAAYTNGDHDSVKTAFENIRAKGMLIDVEADQDISDELSLHSAFDE